MALNRPKHPDTLGRQSLPSALPRQADQLPLHWRKLEYSWSVLNYSDPSVKRSGCYVIQSYNLPHSTRFDRKLASFILRPPAPVYHSPSFNLRPSQYVFQPSSFNLRPSAASLLQSPYFILRPLASVPPSFSLRPSALVLQSCLSVTVLLPPH